jgi:hypothetical protein
VALLALGAFVGSSFIAVPSAHSQMKKLGVGVAWSESGGALNSSARGLLVKYDLNNKMALQGNLHHSGSDLADYTTLKGEFQFNLNSTQNAQFYTGGGFSYSAMGATGTDDLQSVYAPVGLEYNIQGSPVSFMASSAVEYVLDDGSTGTMDSGIELFNDVSLGVMYNF